jgi:GT2 family glycosyltransferase
MSEGRRLTFTAIVVTMNRPEVLRRCLEHLQQQEPLPDQIVVVDSSTDERTIQMMQDYPELTFRRNELGYGYTTLSRNIGLMASTGDIVAYIDDDAFAHPGWIQNLLATYDDDKVGGVGGRALNKLPGEDTQGVNTIGQLSPKGEVLGYFAADPGKILEVDHMVGCNMSVRREIMMRLGGFRTDFLGNEVREETDLCLRVKALGYRLRFNPWAVVDHIPMPRPKGTRSDLRSYYYAERNTYLMLIRNFGLFKPIVFRYWLTSVVRTLREFARYLYQGTMIAVVRVVGTVDGLFSGTLARLRTGSDPTWKERDPKRLSQLPPNSPVSASEQKEAVSEKH